MPEEKTVAQKPTPQKSALVVTPSAEPVKKIEITEEPVVDFSKPFDDTGSNTAKTEKATNNPKKAVLMFFLGVVIGSIFSGGGVYFWMKDNTVSTKQEVVTEEKVVEQTPVPEEDGKKVFSEYRLQVLNGTGVAGTAREMATLLERLGFVEVDTANAVGDEVISTIFMKEGVNEDVFSEIEDILENYSFELLEEVLDETSDFDVIITLGV